MLILAIIYFPLSRAEQFARQDATCSDVSLNLQKWADHHSDDQLRECFLTFNETLGLLAAHYSGKWKHSLSPRRLHPQTERTGLKGMTREMRDEHWNHHSCTLIVFVSLRRRREGRQMMDELGLNSASPPRGVRLRDSADPKRADHLG